MTRREWVMVIAVAALMLLSLWMNYHSQQTLAQQQAIRDQGLQGTLERISGQLDEKKREEVQMLEARIIVLEKDLTEVLVRLEGK